MSIKKIIFVSFLWLVFSYFLIAYAPNILSENTQLFLMNVTNLTLSVASILSVLMIIFGLVGYYWDSYKENKKRKQKFEEMLICGIIVFITDMITYAMVITPSARYFY